MYNGNAAFQGGFENTESDSNWQLITCNVVSLYANTTCGTFQGLKIEDILKIKNTYSSS